MQSTNVFLEYSPSGAPRFLHILSDITDRKRMENELEQRTKDLKVQVEFCNMMQAFCDNAPVAVGKLSGVAIHIVTAIVELINGDTDWEYKYVNKRHLELTGAASAKEFLRIKGSQLVSSGIPCDYSCQHF
jgi:PAS domain-containing protein